MSVTDSNHLASVGSGDDFLDDQGSVLRGDGDVRFSFRLGAEEVGAAGTSVKLVGAKGGFSDLGRGSSLRGERH